MNITFQHPGAWLLVVGIASIVIVWWLYFFRSKNEDWSTRLNSILALMRFIVLFMLGFLLLEPFIIQLISEEEQPKLLVYSDRSASISEADTANVAAFVNAAREELSERFEVQEMPFATDVKRGEESRTLNRLNTNLGAALESVNQDFYGENIGAVVLISDGIINQGKDPRYVGLNSQAPVYTIMLGDTSIRPDVEVSEVMSNKLAFLNNDFEIRARVSARKLKGNQVEMRLMRDGKVLQKRTIEINSSTLSLEPGFIVKADRLGMNKYTIEVDVLEIEANKINNTGETYIDILDNRTKVQILADAPHPDIAALKRTIEASDQYDVEVSLLDDWNGNVTSADLYIWHGIPTDANDKNKLNPITTNKKQVFAFVTSGVSLMHFNAMDLGVRIEAPSLKLDEAGGYINEDFNLFNLKANEDLRRYPPLRTPFGDYKLTSNHQVALFQRIGNISTEKPLLVFTEKDGLKHGVTFAEGWWRWRLYERMTKNSETWTDGVIQKAVQYLAIKQKRTRISVTAPKSMTEGQEITFNAEYYNQAFELNNDPAMELELTDSAGNVLDFLYKPTGNTYKVSVGTLPPGDYSWRSTVSSNGEQFTEEGQFTVARNRSEYVNLVARHGFLQDIATRKNGKAFLPAHQQQLIDELKTLDTAKTVIHTTQEWTSIIDWKILLFILAGLLSAEWFVRKFTGYV